MANPRVTIEGRLGADPELRFTPSGKAVASLRVATNDRRRNQTTQEWEDTDTTWWGVSVWDQMAENCVESLVKGDLVLVHGRIRDREWQDRDGNKRTEKEVIADAVAPSLRFRVQRHGQASERSPNGPQRGAQGQPQGAQGYGQDPWQPQGQPAQQGQQQQSQQQGHSPWGMPDEPPF
jgi:single-strand DNA-binding protein